jgi:hypothetical protein
LNELQANIRDSFSRIIEEARKEVQKIWSDVSSGPKNTIDRLVQTIDSYKEIKCDLHAKNETIKILREQIVSLQLFLYQRNCEIYTLDQKLDKQASIHDKTLQEKSTQLLQKLRTLKDLEYRIEDLKQTHAQKVTDQDVELDLLRSELSDQQAVSLPFKTHSKQQAATIDNLNTQLAQAREVKVLAAQIIARLDTDNPCSGVKSHFEYEHLLERNMLQNTELQRYRAASLENACAASNANWRLASRLALSRRENGYWRDALREAHAAVEERENTALKTALEEKDEQSGKSHESNGGGDVDGEKAVDEWLGFRFESTVLFDRDWYAEIKEEEQAVAAAAAVQDVNVYFGEEDKYCVDACEGSGLTVPNVLREEEDGFISSREANSSAAWIDESEKPPEQAISTLSTVDTDEKEEGESFEHSEFHHIMSLAMKMDEKVDGEELGVLAEHGDGFGFGSDEDGEWDKCDVPEI